MKNTFMKSIAVLLLVSVSLMLVSCNFVLEEKDTETNGNAETESENSSMMLISESKFYESESKYRPVSSYAIEDGNYYYFYYLGVIDAVPLGLESASGAYFNGVPTTLKFSLTTVEGEQQQKVIEDSVENRFSFISADYHKKTLSAGMAKFFKAGIETGVINADINGISMTSSQSYVESISKQTSFEQSISYNMTEKNEVGYYFYTPMASVKVYAVVVYNPQTESIEYVTTYNQYGSALPGIYYSPFSFITLSNFDIEFDESQISDFSAPQTFIGGDYEIEVDANGGDLDVRTISVKLGHPYGNLPTPQKKGYVFAGWYSNSEKVDADSMVLTDAPLQAKWTLLTSYCIKLNQTITVSRTALINPFFYLVPNSAGETEKAYLDLKDFFDMSALKDENYKMRIMVVCDADVPILAVVGYDFKFNIYANGNKIYELNKSIGSKYKGDTIKLELEGNYIPIDLVTGNISYNVSTKNVLELDLKNIQIYVDFKK